MGLKINEIKAEYWKTVEEELLVERFRYFHFNDVSVNKDEVVSFFENNPDSFPVPPSLVEFSVLQKPVEVTQKTKDSLFLFLAFALSDSHDRSFHPQTPHQPPILGGHDYRHQKMPPRLSRECHFPHE